MLEEAIVQRNPDGTTITIPEKSFRAVIDIVDSPARALATLGLVLSSLGVGVGGYAAYNAIWGEKSPITRGVSRDVEATLQAMQNQLDANTMFDCVNENVLRQTYGVPPIDFGGCKQERENFGKKELGAFRAAPTPTPKPTSGG